MDLSDLPLFSGIPATELPQRKRCRLDRRSPFDELIPVVVEPQKSSAANGAALIPFPPSRDTKLVAELARIFINLRDRYGRQCRVMLLDKRFRPIARKLRRMGVRGPEVEAELARLEKAVARAVWVHDGRPSLGSGGGTAA